MNLKKIFSEQGLLDWGIFSFLVLISIGFMTTNELSRYIVVPIRNLAIFSISVILFFLIIRTGIEKMQLLVASLYLIFVFWGMALAFLSGSLEIGATNLIRDTLATLAGLLLLCKARDAELIDKYSGWFLCYIFLGLLVTLAVGGLELSFPPAFYFASFKDGVDEQFYSQATSEFFGLGAIAAAYVTKTMSPGWKRYISGILIFLFLGLSLLGGGRGDSLGAVIIVVGYFLLVSPMKTFLRMGVVTAASLFLIRDWQCLEQLAIYDRLAVFGEGDLGMRDILLSEVVSLSSQEPLCLLTGCGFGYFQTYFGYEFGMYPHNFLAEALIVFGMPLTALGLITCAYGLKLYFISLGRIDFLVLFFSYYLIIKLKGGDILGSWFLNICIFLFIGRALTKMSVAHKRKRVTIS